MTAAVIDQPGAWRRLPLAHFPAVYLEHLGSMAGLGLSVLVFSKSGSWLGGWAWPVVLGLLALRLVQPVYTWISFRYRVTSSGVWTKTGLVKKRIVNAAWDSIAGVQLDAAWYHRPFGLTRVLLLQGGGSDTGHVQLHSIGSDVAAEIFAATERARVCRRETGEQQGQA